MCRMRRTWTLFGWSVGWLVDALTSLSVALKLNWSWRVARCTDTTVGIMVLYLCVWVCGVRGLGNLIVPQLQCRIAFSLFNIHRISNFNNSWHQKQNEIESRFHGFSSLSIKYYAHLKIHRVASVVRVSDSVCNATFDWDTLYVCVQYEIFHDSHFIDSHSRLVRKRKQKTRFIENNFLWNYISDFANKFLFRIYFIGMER